MNINKSRIDNQPLMKFPSHWKVRFRELSGGTAIILFTVNIDSSNKTMVVEQRFNLEWICYIKGEASTIFDKNIFTYCPIRYMSIESFVRTCAKKLLI